MKSSNRKPIIAESNFFSSISRFYEGIVKYKHSSLTPLKFRYDPNPTRQPGILTLIYVLAHAFEVALFFLTRRVSEEFLH